MKRRTANLDAVLKALAVLLIIAALLKGHELAVVPGGQGDLWSARWFRVFQVEFELALGMWLLSGVWRVWAWMGATVCFGLFCTVTFSKAIMGAESCGCFGMVHVNPWITLLAIDLPALGALAVFRPKPAVAIGPFSLQTVHGQLPVDGRVRNLGMIVLVVCAFSTVYLLNHKPAGSHLGAPGEITPRLPYVWAEQPLEIGYCLVAYVSHECPDCVRVIRELTRFTQASPAERRDIRVALIEKYPYATHQDLATSGCVLGILERKARYQVHTPLVELLWNGRIQKMWEASDLERGGDWSEAVRDVIAAHHLAAQAEVCQSPPNGGAAGCVEEGRLRPGAEVCRASEPGEGMSYTAIEDCAEFVRRIENLALIDSASEMSAPQRREIALSLEHVCFAFHRGSFAEYQDFHAPTTYKIRPEATDFHRYRLMNRYGISA